MPLQISAVSSDAALDAMVAEWGSAPLLRIYSGAMPANAAAAATGTLLVEMTLPITPMAAASGGVIAKTGTWTDPLADASGTAAHFRIYDATGTTCHMQGEITDTAGAGPMELSSTAIVAGEPVTVATFTITDPNV